MPDLPSNQLPASLSQLHRLLVNSFDLDEFRTLCLNLNIRYDDLAGETLSAKVRELLLKLKRSKQIEQLITLAEEKRPRIDWRSGPPADVECPYKGLHAFQVEDAKNFFGREEFTAKLKAAVYDQPLVAVIGPSGSGKSSVVFAGLIPELEDEKNWLIADFRPGVDPFIALAQALLPLLEPNVSTIDKPPKARRLATHLQSGDATLTDYLQMIQQEQPTAKLLLYCDQFEELYTQVADVEQRRRFLDVVLAGFDQPDKAYDATLVLTLRADFLGQVLAYPKMVATLQDRDIKIGLMSPDELETAIVQPAANAGVGFADGLVTRILEDVGDHAGNLPLLEFALTLLWERQSDGQMSHAAYEEIGGVSGALARHADETLARLTQDDPALEEAIQRVMVQLVHPGAGAEDTRRIARRTDLDEAGWALVPQLADARLLITNLEDQAIDPSSQTAETVELIHEALIQHWGRLQEWMERDRELRMWQERLRADLKLWQENGQNDGFLLRSAPLSVAEEWLGKRPDDLSSGEIAFIEASLQKRQEREATEEAHRQHELDQANRLAEEQKKGRARLRQIVGVLVAGLLATLVLTILLVNSNQLAKDNEATAIFNEQVAETSAAEAIDAQGTSDANASLAQTRESDAQVAATAEASSRLDAEIAQNLANARYLVSEGQRLFEDNPQLGLSLVLEGLMLAQTHNQESDVLADTQKQMFHLGRTKLIGSQIEDIALSPNEIWLLVDYSNAPGELRDASDGSLIATLSGQLGDSEFSPNETRLLVRYSNAPGELRDASDGSLIATLSGQLGDSEFSPNETRLLVRYSNAPGELRDASDGSLIATLSGQLGRSEFSPNETRLLIDYHDAAGELRDASDRSLLAILSGDVDRWEFSPNETMLLVLYSNAPDELRDTSDGSLPATLSGKVAQWEFSPNGKWLLVDYQDAADELRDASDGSLLATLPSAVTRAEFSPNGKWLRVDYYDVAHSVASELRDANNGSLLATLPGAVAWSEFSSNETLLFAHYSDGNSELLRAANGQLLAPLGANATKITFFSTLPTAIVHYQDGRAYWLDLAWLEAMHEAGVLNLEMELDAAGIQTLIDLACQYPLDNGAVLEQPELRDALQPYLENVSLTEPQACK
ncbi:hypothetical protein [Candidatus Leptofilum sp.]|uniref:nSTAND1 domain-containing NTPase n=1 Tax=Candidatus Leptofilum sp. TaxID=3241576 RepID=UPI003B58D190